MRPVRYLPLRGTVKRFRALNLPVSHQILTCYAAPLLVHIFATSCTVDQSGWGLSRLAPLLPRCGMQILRRIGQLLTSAYL
jgi:hypothetical protein